MLMSDYQRWATRGMTAEDRSDNQRLAILGCMGLAGEAGEVVDHFKKAIFHDGATLDGDKVVLELGGVLWYLSAICTAIGVDLGLIAEENQRKLRERYPDRYAFENECPECGAPGHAKAALIGEGTQYACLSGHSWVKP
jgi:NTP pyrophosphatase (non-canonical NTP hydrolase)